MDRPAMPIHTMATGGLAASPAAELDDVAEAAASADVEAIVFRARRRMGLTGDKNGKVRRFASSC